MDTNMLQWALEAVLGAFGAVLWANYTDVKKMAKKAADDLADYRTHVAEKYATADEVKSVVTEIHTSFEKYGNRIDATLERIIVKLDTKADRRREDRPD